MSAPVQERPHFDYRHDRHDGSGPARMRVQEEPDAPPLLLAGTDDDGTEPHICRSID
ncbi:hypothetical protein NGB36_25125 [Streptomyces sp. RB6PN25]|uniref:Uncharacterized protein n=1 Tax=Streptomyces humicola TaxID=2953240 RepID=A0ABT1Q376_9ACTN|nr:hypothetical protein [Streptomyces humicola]MCQ4083785.1 hypothetical protein [Streptomyces humicola]